MIENIVFLPSSDLLFHARTWEAATKKSEQQHPKDAQEWQRDRHPWVGRGRCAVGFLPCHIADLDDLNSLVLRHVPCEELLEVPHAQLLDDTHARRQAVLLNTLL